LNALIRTPESPSLSVGHTQPAAGHGALVVQFVCAVFCRAPLCEDHALSREAVPGKEEGHTLSSQVHAPLG
jgi:hypothetical protein